MISRLTASAATFAILATASLSYATVVAQHVAVAAPGASAKPVRVVQLETVVITAKRLSSNAN